MNPYSLKLIGALAGAGMLLGRGAADLEILYKNKKMLENDPVKGRDNYYHRKGMCEVGQLGPVDAFIGLQLGRLKEYDDFVKKFWKKPLKENIKDGIKDMCNNIEGDIYGLTNPEKSCTIWLKDLDEETNTWKNK